MSQAKVSILTYSDNPNRRRRSRFIEELIINNNIKVKSYSPKVYDIFTEKNKHLVNSYELEIEKNDEIIRAINSLELSATSFNDYISCTLKFYFSRILKQKAFAEPELKISAATIGNAFHKALEKLVNSKIEDIKEFIQGFEQIFYDELSSHDAFKYSLAQKFVAKEACKAIPDIARTHFLRLNEGWETIQTERVIVAEHLGFHLKGLIDRVDKNNNNYEIIDYKFKTLQPAYEKIDFEKQTDLQTPFYAFLFEKNNDIVVDNLYHFDLKNTFKLEHSFYMSNYEKFKIFLNEKLDELKNKDAKFVKTNKIKACEYCEFATLCGRA